MQIELPLWLDYIERQIGFILPKNQHQWLSNAINGTAVKHGLTFGELYEQVQDDEEVRQSLFDSVLIAESRFFRDMAALDFVVEQYKKHLTANRNELFSVVSVGCSTGQEAWSLAMVLEKAYRTVRGNHIVTPANYRVLGLDVSKTSLTAAKNATYSTTSLHNIPEEYHEYTKQIEKDGEIVWQPIADIQNHVDFVWCNVFLPTGLSDSLKASGFRYLHPHIIICQNMLIYFRRFDQRDILGRMVDLLTDGGHLVLSAVDGAFWRHERMQRLHHDGANIWYKDLSPSSV